MDSNSRNPEESGLDGDAGDRQASAPAKGKGPSVWKAVALVGLGTVVTALVALGVLAFNHVKTKPPALGSPYNMTNLTDLPPRGSPLRKGTKAEGARTFTLYWMIQCTGISNVKPCRQNASPGGCKSTGIPMQILPDCHSPFLLTTHNHCSSNAAPEAPLPPPWP